MAIPILATCGTNKSRLSLSCVTITTKLSRLAVICISEMVSTENTFYKFDPESEPKFQQNIYHWRVASLALVRKGHIQPLPEVVVSNCTVRATNCLTGLVHIRDFIT